jgi:hypothetical protein
MANRPTGLWQALEAVPGAAAVDAEWKARLGNDYGTAKAFLRPNGKLASSYPCTIHGGCGCQHDVVNHGGNDIVAVCRCERGCETFPLQRSDVVVYELNRRVLDTALVRALDLTEETYSTTDLHGTTRIGVYSPYAGYRFPVYLAIQLEPDDFRRTVEGLVAREDGPFILLAPTRELCRPDSEKLLNKKGARFLPLSEILVLKDDGKFATDKPIGDILADFRAAVLPTPEDSGSMVFFPTPPSATWGDVSIKFRDGHTVSVKVGEAGGTYNYTQMGMADARNGNPTKQWKLLESFATGHGKLDWSHPDAARKNQKRRENLANNLQAFFRIEEDPIRWTKDGMAWEARFSISYDE